MNIFEKTTGILGSPIAYGGSLSDLLTDVKRVRQKLGRQCFLMVPLLSLYIQGFTNDLLYCLTTRDEETSKQIFQLLLDMPNFEA